MVRAKAHVTNILHICCQDSRLREVSYFSLQSYRTQNLSTRAAKPRAARNEGVSPRRKNKRPSFLAWSQSLIVIITSWFAIALDEVRTRQILREKADCRQSTRTLFCRITYLSKRKSKTAYDTFTVATHHETSNVHTKRK